jgi:hypothetical protein
VHNGKPELSLPELSQPIHNSNCGDYSELLKLTFKYSAFLELASQAKLLVSKFQTSGMYASRVSASNEKRKHRGLLVLLTYIALDFNKCREKNLRALTDE